MDDHQSEWIGENVINIMVATDNHLGYCEHDPIRRNDSFVAFEEILALAAEKKVDFILLGGDLFHEAKPSNSTLFKCFKLLRQYTQGDRESSLEFAPATSQALESALHPCVNIKDPTIKVSIPIFSISGNHERGSDKKSPLDLLAITGLVNYFGFWTSQNAIDIKPIILRKGETQLALYGLSYMSDGQLNNAFENGMVNIKPQDPSAGEWFNLMVLHQNRFNRNPSKVLPNFLGQDFIPEKVLPNFLDLVVWGHEHVCRIKAEEVNERRFQITQPGSSVATKLSKGESMHKKVALLQVWGKKFQIIPHRLQTVRPFIYDSLNLIECALNSTDEASKQVEQLVKNKIEKMLASAKNLLTGHPKQPTLPLLRLQIKYSDESHVFNRMRFGHQYDQMIANPTDLIIFAKPAKKDKTVKNDVSEISDNCTGNEESDDDATLENYIGQYFEKSDKKLQTLELKHLNDMCKLILDKKEVTHILSSHQEKAIQNLMSNLNVETFENDKGSEILSKRARFE